MLCPDQTVSAVFRSVFGSEGITLRCLSFVGDGMSLLARNKYDAVVVDCDDLQEGYDLLSSLRNCPSNKSSIAFAISSGKASVKTAYAAGATFVLEKPITSAGVSKAMRAASGLILRERHRYLRHPINVSMCMMFYGADLENEVRLINVSEGGLAISTSVPRKVEGNVAFRFQLPETKTLIVVRGRVAWSKDQSKFGIEFAPPVNLSRQQLNDWLTRRTYDPPKPAREAMAAASPAPVKSPEIVFLPSLLKPSHPLPKVVQVPPLEVLPLAGFQAATTSRVPPLAGFQATTRPVPPRAAPSVRIQNKKVATGTRNRKKSLVVLFAALVLSVGGWMATILLLPHRSEASSPSATRTVDAAAVGNPHIRVLASKPAEEKVRPSAAVINPQAAVLAIKPAEKNVISDAAVGAAQTKVPAAQEIPVVDLLSSDNHLGAVPGRNPAQSDSALEAPSLGTVVASRPSASLASSIAASSAAAPRLSHASVVEPEVLIHKVAPVYPKIARGAHVDGEVLVRLTIAKDGSIKNAVIEKGPFMLRDSVLEAVRQWKYKPYRLDNQPQEIQTLVSVKFH